MTTIVTIDMGGTGATHAAGAREALSVPSMTDMGQSYAQANSARDQANTAYGQANAAYGTANTKLDAAGGTISGNLIVTGTLTITGNASSLNTQSISSVSNEIVLNSNTSGEPSLDAKLTVNRGSSSNVSLRWNESINEWGWTDDGTSTYYFEDLRLGLSTVNTSLGTINTNYQAAYAQANTAETNALNAYGQANTARNQANTAYAQANNARSDANTTFGTINTTFGTVNTSLGTMNTQLSSAQTWANIVSFAAYAQANSAYAAANTRLSSSGGTISGDLSVTGNLFVEGDSTTFNVATLLVEDSEIYLNSNQATPSLNASIFAERGSSADAFIRWNEGVDKWGWSDDGTTFYSFENVRSGLVTTNTTFGTINTSLGTINTSLGTINTNYQAAYAQANTAGTNALNAYGQANTARSDANTTFATINTTFATLNTSAGTQNTAITTANDQANTARSQANTARDTANSAYGQANTATTNAGTAGTNALNAYGQANTAGTNALNAYGTANTAATNALNAYGQANAAYAQANSAYGAANNRVLKAGDTMTGNLTLSGASLVLSSTSNDQRLIDAEGASATGRHVAFPLRFMIGSASTGYPFAGYNAIPRANGAYSYSVGDTAWGISYGNNSRMGFYYAASGTAGANISFSELMTIAASGNVGIGIGSATQKLDVVGIIKSSGASNSLMIENRNDSTKTWEWYAQGTSSSGFLGLYKNHNTPGTPFVVTDTGNVGIGTTSPSAKLHTYVSTSTDDIAAVIEGTGSYGSGLHLKASGTSGRTWRLISTGTSSTPGAGAFGVYDSTAGLYRFVMDTNGNVGIGTTSPTGRLNVYVDSDTNISIGEHPSYGAYNAIWSPSNDYVLLWQNGGHTFLNARGTGDIFFREDNNTLMTLTNGGNLGIGNSPASRLDVSGVSSLRNGIQFFRVNSASTGLSFYNSTYSAWCVYMAATGVGSCGPHGNFTSPGSGHGVTSWALRSFIENSSGYGFTWETGTSTGNPTVIAGLEASTGNFSVAGTVTANSDERVKKNIRRIDNALDKVKNIDGVYFEKINSEETSIGVIAQQVEKVLPEVVKLGDPNDPDSIKSVAYGNMVGLLIEAIKEQQKQIEELKSKLSV